MFTPRGSTPRPRASPYPSATRSQSRRVSNVFSQKSRNSSFVGKSQTNRSLQTSQLIEETAGHKVATYGTPLPVLITEALTLADRNTEITVKIDPSGWAWLVGGRKLFIWKHKQSPSNRGVFCKELTLPPSDLAHNADRVCVIPSNSDSQTASCVAVSPEGIVRYWSNIAYEGSSVEISAELRGDECACVINFPPFGCILATTTSSLVLLTPVKSQNTVTCQPMKGSQGMFSGIGRRMSSFIFGASPLQPSGAPLQAIVCGKMEDDDRPFYVLSGTQLQKWSVSEIVTEKLFYQIDVDRMFRESLARKIWDQDSRHLTQLKTWLLDMQPTQHGVVLLGVGVNMDVDLTAHFALGFIDTDVGGTPSELESLMIMEHKDRYHEELELQLQNYKLLTPDPNSATSYIYDKDRILFVPGPTADVDVIDLPPPGGNLLGAGICEKQAVFFSTSFGLFTVTSTQKQEMSFMDESQQQDVLDADLSALTANNAKIQELSISEDRTDQLKGAFLAALRGSVDMAQKTIAELFPLSEDIVSDLDQVVVNLDRFLIDDYSQSDPRWAEARQDTVSSTASLIIINQLNDKLKAHEYVITFLKKMGLWERLQVVPIRDGRMLTRHVLCEHAEKVEAAIALRQLHTEYTAVIDAAIKKVLQRRGTYDIPKDLLPQDVFYREVSSVHEIADCLLEYEEEVLMADVSSAEILAVVSSINAVLEGMYHKALQRRQQKCTLYDAEREITEIPEYIPWTSTSGDRGIRSLLIKQYNKTLQVAIPEVSDNETLGFLYQQLVGLADVVLDGYSCQLESLRHSPHRRQYNVELQRKYEQDRQALIMPLYEGEQYELAASLAEKYFDFDVLIQICEVTNNSDRIERYITHFADKGFSDRLYAWYMKEGKRGKLLSLPVHQHQKLTHFLQSDDVRYLSWLHDIQTQDFDKAHHTLLELGRTESKSLSKKKTLLSLSKLAALAADDTDADMEANIAAINEERDLIVHQEQLPPLVIENLGMEPDNMKVLAPTELIQLYISGTNLDATEYDFKKALDLLQYIDRNDPVSEALRLHIWAKAVVRDGWTRDEAVDPIDTIMNTVFFKTIDIAFKEGLDLRTFLPDLDSLLQSEELGHLRDDPSFQYLIKAGYEHIRQVL